MLWGDDGGVLWMVGCPEAVGGRDTPHALGAVVFGDDVSGRAFFGFGTGSVVPRH